MPLGRRILVFAALAGMACSQAAWSQTALTTIQDTLFSADGTRFTGTLSIQWSTFDASNLGTVVQQNKTVPVVNGNLDVQLAANSGAQPPANVYTVQYQSDGSQQFTETWTVPASATALTVRQVRTGIFTGSTGTSGSGNSSGGGSGPVAEASVTGLVSDLSQRPTKGAAFGANGVAIVDNNGILETAVGQVGDCVMVDGTTGPCGAPTFADAETPAGTVDGTNATFTLNNTPSGTSLMLFRNGVYQTVGFDYTLSGNSIRFAAGAVPQPGDTLTASYRVDPSAAGSVALVATSTPVTRSSTTAQVICNASGIGTRIGVWTTLGSCDIPASQLRAGDRIEVRFSFAHVGRTSGFDISVNWGVTNVLSRHGGAQDAAIVGTADAAIGDSGALVTVQSWGTVLQFLPGIVSAGAQSGVAVSLSASTGTSQTDSVQLSNFTVLRYPAN